MKVRSTILFAGFITGCMIFMLSCTNDSSENKVEEFIDTVQLSNRVLVVSMGYDAVTAIETTKGIVIVDAGISVSLSKKYLRLIKKAFGRSDFKWLINTHSHADHVGGNQAFGGAAVIGHENCQKEFLNQNKDREKTRSQLLKIVEDYDKEIHSLKAGSVEWIEVFCQRSRYWYALNDLSDKPNIKGWDITFSDTLNIKAGDATMNLFWFGKAHSASDILIHIPELKLLFTGDLFFPGGRPSIGDPDKEQIVTWQRALEWIISRQNEIETVVGGHGQIMTREDLNAFIAMVRKMCLELDSKLLSVSLSGH